VPQFDSIFCMTIRHPLWLNRNNRTENGRSTCEHVLHDAKFALALQMQVSAHLHENTKFLAGDLICQTRKK
jgi:hypothetical protein